MRFQNSFEGKAQGIVETPEDGESRSFFQGMPLGKNLSEPGRWEFEKPWLPVTPASVLCHSQRRGHFYPQAVHYGLFGFLFLWSVQATQRQAPVLSLLCPLCGHRICNSKEIIIHSNFLHDVRCWTPPKLNSKLSNCGKAVKVQIQKAPYQLRWVLKNTYYFIKSTSGILKYTAFSLFIVHKPCPKHQLRFKGWPDKPRC